ncbi:MAG: hypothetical protein LBM74_02230 [Oscillospiraceae bacterium]|nr:hypothetical protein [Oscillospiraceae bacterium]
MKKWMAGLLVCALLLGSAGALAADLGVMMPGGANAPTQARPASLEDMQDGVPIAIPGYGDVMVICSLTYDTISTREYIGGVGATGYTLQPKTYRSGVDADYATLFIRIVNMQRAAYDYLPDITDIMFTYDTSYSFIGWAYQAEASPFAELPGVGDMRFYRVWEGDHRKPIEMLYTGYYLIGATLPNMVFETTAPLSVTFKLNGNEVTYHIRK